MGEMNSDCNGSEYDIIREIVKNEENERVEGIQVADIATDGGAISKEYKNVDDLLQDIGANGPFQWLLMTTLLLIHVPGVLSTWIAYFFTAEVHWRCVSNSTSCTLNQTMPASDNRLCHLNNTQWLFVDETETSIKSHFHLQCGKEWLVHLATSSLFAGWAISSLFGSTLADRSGRKVVLFASLLIFLLTGMILPFSQGIEMFIVFRFFMGAAIPGLFQVVYMMLGEITNNKHRILFMNMIQVGHTVALILLGVLASFVGKWQTLVLLTTCPFALVLLMYKFVPESLHWLVLKGQQAKLVSVVKRVCYWNSKPIPDDNLLSNFSSDELKHCSRLTDLFQTELRIQSWKVLFCWLVIGMIYYGIGMAADDLTGAFYRDFIIVRSIELPSQICGVYVGKRLGRRKMVSISMMLASVSCVLIGAVPATGDIALIRLLLGVLGTFFITFTFIQNLVWTMELYGTDLRSHALGAATFTCRLGGALAPWIVKGLKHYNPDAPFFLNGGLGIGCAMLLWTLKETEDTPLRVSSVRKSTVISNTKIEENNAESLRDTQNEI